MQAYSYSTQQVTFLRSYLDQRGTRRLLAILPLWLCTWWIRLLKDNAKVWYHSYPEISHPSIQPTMDQKYSRKRYICTEEVHFVYSLNNVIQ